MSRRHTPYEARAAIVLAAGHDEESRALLTRPLGDSTVVQHALGNLSRVVDPARTVVVVAPGDTAVRRLVGDEYRVVEQAERLGTGHATLAAREALPADAPRVLVGYGDMPLLRPESLLGLFTRHALKGAELSILTAVVASPDPDYGRIVRRDGAIAEITEGEDQTADHEGIHEVNVGGYVMAPDALFSLLDTMAGSGEHRLTDLARRVIASGGRVRSYEIHDADEVQGINSDAGLRAAEDIVLKRLFVPRKNTDTTIVFGTGGWRAVIGEGYTMANVRRLTQAIANEVVRTDRDAMGVVIGGDRRFLSRDSAIAAAEVFAGNNIPVTLLPDDVPTPLVTFAAPYLGAAYGIIVTSSHNPPEWNGMKVFRSDGSLPLDEETDRYQDEANEMGIEDVITLDIDLARAAGMVVDKALTNPYVDAIEEIVDVDAARNADLHVIVDPMYGTSQLTLGMILNDMRVRTEFIHAAHNPLFGGVAPAPDIERLQDVIGMIKHGGGRYDLGLATDGDSDRIGIVDEQGEYVSTNDLLLLLYWYLHEVRGESGGVVRNLATTHLLDRLAAHFGERSYECKVGFKYVTAGMDEIGAVLGGESSGGLTVRGWIKGKDGIYACALVVEMLARTGKKISELRHMIYEITGRLYSLDMSVAATPEMRIAVPRRLQSQPLTHIGPYPVVGVSAAQILDLEQFLDRKPKAMSGGQRQRVAMGRAIVRKPQVFLMDEPLSNLDAKLRVQTRTQIAKLQKDLGVTTVYVTHDQTEAMTMGDRIAVLKDGLLMQVGTPQELYDQPANVFVAGFIGSPAMNLIEVPVHDGAVTLGGKDVALPGAAASELAQHGRSSVMLGFRPEDLRLVAGERAWPIEVTLVEGLGADAYVYGDVVLSGGKREQVVVRADGRFPPKPGDVIAVEIEAHHVHLFDPDTGERLHYSTDR